jgi:hypothetical protein
LSFPNAFSPKADLHQRRISLGLKPQAEIGSDALRSESPDVLSRENPDEAMTGSPTETFGDDRREKIWKSMKTSGFLTGLPLDSRPNSKILDMILAAKSS